MAWDTNHRNKGGEVVSGGGGGCWGGGGDRSRHCLPITALRQGACRSLHAPAVAAGTLYRGVFGGPGAALSHRVEEDVDVAVDVGVVGVPGSRPRRGARPNGPASSARWAPSTSGQGHSLQGSAPSVPGGVPPGPAPRARASAAVGPRLAEAKRRPLRRGRRPGLARVLRVRPVVPVHVDDGGQVSYRAARRIPVPRQPSRELRAARPRGVGNRQLLCQEPRLVALDEGPPQLEVLSDVHPALPESRSLVDLRLGRAEERLPGLAPRRWPQGVLAERLPGVRLRGRAVAQLQAVDLELKLVPVPRPLRHPGVLGGLPGEGEVGVLRPFARIKPHQPEQRALALRCLCQK